MKQGDLGNLYQLVEVLRCYRTVLGIYVNNDGALKIFPRMPCEWGVKIERMPVEGTNAHLAVNVTYPKDGVQLMVLKFSEDNAVGRVKVRFGPFPLDTAVCRVQINGEEAECKVFKSGDSKWALAEFFPTRRMKIAAMYSSDSNLPKRSINWPVLTGDNFSNS